MRRPIDKELLRRLKLLAKSGGRIRLAVGDYEEVGTVFDLGRRHAILAPTGLRSVDLREVTEWEVLG